MNIGIVGLGIIGSALKYSFEKLGHTVKVHDLLLNTKLEELIDCEIIYICVPTPSLCNGECNVSIVQSVVENLIDLNYQNQIAIKSTVEPGFTQSMIEKHCNNNICFVPEFLRERCAISDFMENHDLLAIGSSDKKTIEVVKNSHGKYPKNVIEMKPTEAELLKYYSNTLNALRIVFANEFYEICNVMNSDYNTIKEAYLMRNTKDMYLDVNENFRGYAGVCLPKDTKAMAALCEKLNLDLKLFEVIDKENSKFKKTVFENMREQ